MTWLFIALGWARKGLSALAGVVTRYPWQAGCIALLCLAGWFYHGRQNARHELAEMIAAQKAAAGAQKRVNDAAETHYKEVANVADTNHDTIADAAWDATERFVASHRVQPQDRTCKAPAPARGDDPRVPPEVPASVVVDTADVRTCADLYAYSVAAHDWAQSLKVPESLLPDK